MARFATFLPEEASQVPALSRVAVDFVARCSHAVPIRASPLRRKFSPGATDRRSHYSEERAPATAEASLEFDRGRQDFYGSRRDQDPFGAQAGHQHQKCEGGGSCLLADELPLGHG